MSSTAWTTTAPATSDKPIAINNAADISVIVIYFLVVLAVGLWVGLDFSPLLPALLVRNTGTESRVRNTFFGKFGCGSYRCIEDTDYIRFLQRATGVRIGLRQQ